MQPRKAAFGKKKKDPYGAGPANLLKESTRRGFSASPTNFLGAKKKPAGKPPSEPVSP